MIIPDVNLLIYAYDKGSRFHSKTGPWWEECLSGRETVGLAWLVVLGFVRIMTSARVFRNPMPVHDAIRHARSWLECPPVQMLQPGPRHADIVFGYLQEVGTAANLTTDAHLAALAQEYQGVLHTTDLDFSRFRGLRWRNPLA